MNPLLTEIDQFQAELMSQLDKALVEYVLLLKFPDQISLQLKMSKQDHDFARLFSLCYTTTFVLSLALLYPVIQSLLLVQCPEEKSALNIYLTSMGLYVVGRFIDYLYPKHDFFGPLRQEFLNIFFPILSIASIFSYVIGALTSLPKISPQRRGREKVEELFNSHPEIKNDPELYNKFFGNVTPKSTSKSMLERMIKIVRFMGAVCITVMLCDFLERLSRVIAMQLMSRTTQLIYPESIFETETLLFKLKMPANINAILQSTIEPIDKSWNDDVCFPNYTGNAQTTAHNLFTLHASRGTLSDFFRSRTSPATLENIIECSLQVLPAETQKAWSAHFDVSFTHELTGYFANQLLAHFQNSINEPSNFLESMILLDHVLVPTLASFNETQKTMHSNIVDDIAMQKILRDTHRPAKHFRYHIPVTKVNSKVDTKAFDHLVSTLSHAKDILFKKASVHAEMPSKTAPSL